MANLMTILNDRIARVARRELRKQTLAVRRASVQHRRDIIDLKREVAKLTRAIWFLERQEKRRVQSVPSPERTDGMRFRADGMRTHRAKLGLSAKDYGRLVGVSGLTIYHWENGKAKPRRLQLAKLATVRGIGKREAAKRLQMLDAE